MPCHTRMKTTILQGVIWLCLLLFGIVSSAIEPGFLDFDNLPDTNFTCVGKVIGGYYADLETNCQMFHVCTIGQLDEPMDIRFLCLNGTVFDQETRVCERIDEVDCSKSEKFYHLNLELYGNTAPPIVEEPEPTPSTTTTTQKTTTTFRTTRPTYTTTTTTKTRPQHQTPKIIESHHFPSLGHHHQHTGADIRFNPEEINIRLNPGQPPIIKPQQNKYQRQRYNEPKLTITTHRNILRNFPITTSTTQRPKFKKYQHFDYSYQQTENSDLDYNTELPTGYGYFDSSYEEDLSKEYSNIHLPTTSKPKIYQTEKPNLQILHSLVSTLPPFTISSPSPFTIRHFDQKRSNGRTNEPPRVIISASASVSDASGRRLNYSLGTIEASHLLGTPPHSYDEYKEADVVLDPFYYDVPKVSPQQKHTRSKRQTSRRRGRTKFVPPDYVDDNYEPLTYEEVPKHDPTTQKLTPYQEVTTKKPPNTDVITTHSFKITTEKSKASIQPQKTKKQPTKQDIELYNKLLDQLVEEIIKEALNNRNKQKIPQKNPTKSGNPLVRVITFGNTPRPFGFVGGNSVGLNPKATGSLNPEATGSLNPEANGSLNPKATESLKGPNAPTKEDPSVPTNPKKDHIGSQQSTERDYNVQTEKAPQGGSLFVQQNTEGPSAITTGGKVLVGSEKEVQKVSHAKPNLSTLADEYALLSPLLTPDSFEDNLPPRESQQSKLDPQENRDWTPETIIPVSFEEDKSTPKHVNVEEVSTTLWWTYEFDYTTHKPSSTASLPQEVSKQVLTTESLLHLEQLTTQNSIQEGNIYLDLNDTSLEGIKNSFNTTTDEMETPKALEKERGSSHDEVSTAQIVPTVQRLDRRRNRPKENPKLPTLLDILQHNSGEEALGVDNQNLQSTQQEVVAKIPEDYHLATSEKVEGQPLPKENEKDIQSHDNPNHLLSTENAVATSGNGEAFLKEEKSQNDLVTTNSGVEVHSSASQVEDTTENLMEITSSLPRNEYKTSSRSSFKAGSPNLSYDEVQVLGLPEQVQTSDLPGGVEKETANFPGHALTVPGSERGATTLPKIEQKAPNLPGQDGQPSTVPGPEGEASNLPRNEVGASNFPGHETKTSTFSRNEKEQSSNLPGREGQASTVPGPEGETSTLPNNDFQTSSLPGQEPQTSIYSRKEKEQSFNSPGQEEQTSTLPGNEVQASTLPGHDEEATTIPENEVQASTLPGNEVEASGLAGHEAPSTTLPTIEEVDVSTLATTTEGGTTMGDHPTEGSISTTMEPTTPNEVTEAFTHISTTEGQLQLFTSRVVKEESSQEGSKVLQMNQIMSNEETSNVIQENFPSTEPVRFSGRRRGYDRNKDRSWRRNEPKTTTGRHRFSSPSTRRITTENNQKDKLVTEPGYQKSVNPTESKNPHSTTPLNKLIKNGFNCLEKKLNHFYEDMRDCRLFHYCTHGFSDTQVLDMKFVCDLGTYFDIDKLICTRNKPTNCK